MSDRTGKFSKTRYISQDTAWQSVKPTEIVEATQEILKQEVGNLILSAIDDGRTYAVKFGEIEVVEEGKTTAYSLHAFVTLLKPEEAKIGEWVHLGSLTTGAEASMITLAAAFERHKLG